MANATDISKLRVNGTDYNVKDAEARSGLGDKVDKVTGKGLSTEDYTTAEKNKLAGIPTGTATTVNFVSGSYSDGVLQLTPATTTVWVPNTSNN